MTLEERVEKLKKEIDEMRSTINMLDIRIKSTTKNGLYYYAEKDINTGDLHVYIIRDHTMYDFIVPELKHCYNLKMSIKNCSNKDIIKLYLEGTCQPLALCEPKDFKYVMVAQMDHNGKYILYKAEEED